ncbi:hypothetical protein [Methanoculleus sp. MH98A]|uniref:hypothetical protein n=1 Tax=Methanoculleus sp. MH98A TaxID=1495314 RepID=UPI0004A0653E|nr:hypothetical protein [Methanoculleus sp. MH98A]KDE55788.1 hypothetical protein EI28_04600 [Methanoculleus sp. MH98A]
MQGRHVLILILIAAAVVAGGCTGEEDTAGVQPASPTPAPPEAQAVGGDLQPAPTPAVPTRGEEEPQSVGFVDPATYHIATPTPTTTMMNQPNDVRVSGKMVEYAEVTCEYPPRVLATEVYHIPFPYWAFTVSATPMNEFPWLAVEIRDPDDPNRIVKEIRYSRNDILVPDGNSDGKEERFIIRDGYGDYYFSIRSESLESLTITIYVPEKYLV